MKNEKGKRGVPIFLKILIGVIVIYLAVSFFGGVFFGGQMNMKAGIANDDVRVGGQSYNDSESMVEEKGMVMPEVASMGKRTNGIEAMPIIQEDEFMAGNIEIPEIEKKIIKNGFVELKVDSARESAEKISDIAKKFGGNVFSSNSYRQSNGGLRGNLTIKVPVDKFDEAMKAVKESGEKVISESVSANDVTSEYVDLQAQLENKKVEEETFKNLLNRSGDLNDVLSITREISRVRGQIDRIEGQLKYMSSQTDMSVINVTLTEFVEIATDRDAWKPLRVIKASLHNLILNAQNFVDGLIKFVIVQLPILIVIASLILFAYKVVMKIYYKFKK